MPRPTAAQFTYGALTVVFATLTMLVLSQTRSGTGIVVIAVTALASGVLVALTTASRTPASGGTRRTASRARTPGAPDGRQPRPGHDDTLCTTAPSRRR